MSARYHIQRYSSVKLAVSAVGDFPIAAGLLQDPTLATNPPTLTAQGSTNGAWLAGFANECAMENIALWIQPLTTSNINWKIQLNGNDLAAYVATTGAPLPKNVFSLSGPLPAKDLVLNASIQNNSGGVITVSVWWVALIRNPLV